MKRNKQKAVLSAFLLMLTAALWGTAFVFQTTGMEHVGPNTFNGMRFLVAAAVLLPIFLYCNRKRLHSEDILIGLRGGALIGMVLLFAGMTQQIGLLTITVGKAGFIAVLYIVIVPLIQFFMGDKLSGKMLACVLLALLGLYFLTMKGSFRIEKGDFFMLLSAFLYALHIMSVARYSQKGNSLVITITQFTVAGFLSFALALWLEKPGISSVLLSYKEILYTGVISCALGYTFQVIGQKNLDSTLASLIMSLESVFAALAAYLILGQTLSTREVFGCVLVFIAIVAAQLPDREKAVKVYI